MSEPRFKIGDTVWRATFGSMTPVHVQCPECGGHGRIRCIMHDETIVSVECRGCQAGYDPPKGYVIAYEHRAGAELGRVVGIEIKASGVDYRIGEPDHAWIMDECNVFASEAEALARAAEMAADADRESHEKIARKEKDHRSWSWHAHYHRSCIRRAQKEIEYHTAKLNVASVKAKEDRAALKSTDAATPSGHTKTTDTGVA